MGGICTIFDCFTYTLQWLLPRSLDTDLSLLRNFSSDDIPRSRLELACGNGLIMSKKLFSVLDSLLRSYRQAVPYTFALLAKNFVSISEGHEWDENERTMMGHMRNERCGLPYVDNTCAKFNR
jgi:hypothetical protein